MFSYKVLAAPAPTHKYSSLALRLGVRPYSMPVPAARPACHSDFETQAITPLLQAKPTVWLKLEVSLVRATPTVP
jgi:hypothetical protein